jgi:membrane fusion protein (multidrug efflux system)
MEEKVQNTSNRKRKKIAFLIFAVIGVIAIVSTFIYIQYKKTHITTDDAFVDGNIHTIASKVPGTVKSIYVTSNQFVKKGELILELDPSDYMVKSDEASAAVNAEKVKLAETEARIEVAKSHLSEIIASIGAAKANLEAKEAQLKQAELDMKRGENLYRKEGISKERYEKTATSYAVALAEVKTAREQLRKAENTLETQRSVVRQAELLKTAQFSVIKEKEAKLNAAELNSGYTKISSPSDGYVTKKSVEPGNQIKTGQPLMAIVPLDGLYVTANYKETQLENVRPGQKVKIKVDSYPGKVFWGKIDSIMAGTGAVFSLFPPENATGNYVKVVQRIPVKIVFNKDTDKEHVLRIGMSVIPTIFIEQ